MDLLAAGDISGVPDSLGRLDDAARVQHPLDQRVPVTYAGNGLLGVVGIYVYVSVVAGKPPATLDGHGCREVYLCQVYVFFL